MLYLHDVLLWIWNWLNWCLLQIRCSFLYKLQNCAYVRMRTSTVLSSLETLSHLSWQQRSCPISRKRRGDHYCPKRKLLPTQRDIIIFGGSVPLFSLRFCVCTVPKEEFDRNRVLASQRRLSVSSCVRLFLRRPVCSWVRSITYAFLGVASLRHPACSFVIVEELSLFSVMV